MEPDEDRLAVSGPALAHEKAVNGGLDRAISSRAQDYLNRWPLAAEVYKVATKGPNWSVRIGVYGEWGTGKTSVLRLVEQMAKQDDHIVVWFDPWEHAAKPAMWRAFILAVYTSLEMKVGKLGAAKKARAKALLGRGKDILATASALVNEKAGKVVAEGLDLLRAKFTFSKSDVDQLIAVIGNRRVIVLIDDLDRTAPELVPEMLFALKEIMDIPRFSFVCAFDPAVVGKVLHHYHPGFGDGLKFLEKIIDYPRWLPTPTLDRLTVLAEREADLNCEYVPKAALREMLPLVPPNPRVLRQFIRLLALIRPQVERRHPHELQWQIILPATLLKIRCPNLAEAILDDRDFWQEVQGLNVRRIMDKEDNKEATIDTHVGRIAQAKGVSLSQDERVRICGCLSFLVEKTTNWLSMTDATLLHQLHLTERPTVITWKEFESLATAWLADRTPVRIQTWMETHSTSVGLPVEDIYRELLQAAPQARCNVLGHAAEATSIEDMGKHLRDAADLLCLIEQLVFDLPGFVKEPRIVTEDDIKQFWGSMTHYMEWVQYMDLRQVRKGETSLLLRLAHDWQGDVAPLVDLLRPFCGTEPFGFHGKAVPAIRKKMIALTVPRLAGQMVVSLETPGFIRTLFPRESSRFDMRCLLMDPAGSLWKGHRRQVLSTLRKASDSEAVRGNAIELLELFGYMLRKEQGLPETIQVTTLLKNATLSRAIWRAAASRLLTPRFVAGLDGVRQQIASIGVPLAVPRWWKPTLKELDLPKPTLAGTVAPPTPSAPQDSAPTSEPADTSTENP